MDGNATTNVDSEISFSVRVRFDDPLFVVEMSGELDLASRTAAIRACTTTDHGDVLVDLSELTFMDCAGYGALASAAKLLEARGGSLVMMSPVGEPRRLLALIEGLGEGLCAPLHHNGVPALPATTAIEQQPGAQVAVA
jgi:anti-sigma B factor antagonist